MRFEAPIFFGNADYFHQSVLSLVDEHVPSPQALVLVCDAVSDIDLTGLDALRDLVEEVQRAGIEVRMCRVKGPVHDALIESGLVDVVGAQHFYDRCAPPRRDVRPTACPSCPSPTQQDDARRRYHRAVAISSSAALGQPEADVLEEPHRTAAMQIAQLGWRPP